MGLSAAPEHAPGVLGVDGGGAAPGISDIPFHHLLSTVGGGIIDGKYVANPTYTETRASKLNMIVAGSDQGIVMVEAGAQQVTEEEVLGALEHGLESCRKIIEVLKQLVAAAGKPKKSFTAKQIDPE